MILGFDGLKEASETSEMRLASPTTTWDPHNSRSCVVGFDSTLQVVDTREMEVTHQRPSAHKGFVRSVTCTIMLCNFINRLFYHVEMLIITRTKHLLFFPAVMIVLSSFGIFVVLINQ